MFAALIPARDEAPRLGAVLAGVRAALPDAALVVVDGGSTDATCAVARAAGATVLTQPGRGYADALQCGYRYLLAQRVQAVLQLDADGQHPPAALPALLAALAGADWVIGSRQGTGCGGPLLRRLGNAALARVVRRALDQPLYDVTSGLWALGPRALALFAADFPAEIADANVRVLGARQGLRLREIPVAMPLRSSGRSMHDGLAGVRHFRRSLHATLQAARA